MATVECPYDRKDDFLVKLLTLFAAFSLTAFAGGLYLEISQGAPGTLLKARVTACHEPAKSTLTAHSVTIVDGQIKRQPLGVAAVPNQPGVFTVSGQLPSATAIVELAVTNPEYEKYEPRVLIRSSAGKAILESKKHFFSRGPQMADYRQAIAD